MGDPLLAETGDVMASLCLNPTPDACVGHVDGVCRLLEAAHPSTVPRVVYDTFIAAGKHTAPVHALTVLMLAYHSDHLGEFRKWIRARCPADSIRVFEHVLPTVIAIALEAHAAPRVLAGTLDDVAFATLADATEFAMTNYLLLHGGVRTTSSPTGLK